MPALKDAFSYYSKRLTDTTWNSIRVLYGHDCADLECSGTRRTAQLTLRYNQGVQILTQCAVTVLGIRDLMTTQTLRPFNVAATLRPRTGSAIQGVNKAAPSHNT